MAAGQLVDVGSNQGIDAAWAKLLADRSGGLLSVVSSVIGVIPSCIVRSSSNIVTRYDD
jgi:hypothetical protein